MRKKMKRIISILFIPVLLFSFPFSVSASTNSELDEFAFELSNIGNNYTLTTHYKDNLWSQITWIQGQDTMTVYRYNFQNRSLNKSSSTIYTIRISDYIQTGNSAVPMLSASDWYYYATVRYNYSTALSATESVGIYYRSTGISEEPYVLQANQNSLIDELLALLLSNLIGSCIGYAYTGIETIASALLSEFISSNGATVISGILQDAFVQSYECVRYEQDIRGYSNYLKEYTPTYSGEHCYIYFEANGDPQNYEIRDFGWSVYNCRNDLFAMEMWTDLHATKQFPGVDLWI